MVNPTHEPHKERNALEIDSVKPQTPHEIATLLMNWMDEEHFSFQQASEIIGISRFNLSCIITGQQLSDNIRLKLANTVPGIKI